MNKSQIFRTAHTIARNNMKNPTLYGTSFATYREALSYGLKIAYQQANPTAAIIKEIAANADKIICREAATPTCIGTYTIKLEDDRIKMEVNLVAQDVEISRAYGREKVTVSLSKVAKYLPF